MKIKKGDKVVITKGEDRGRTGRVIKSLPEEKRLLVEEANLVKKRVRAEKRGEEGKTLQIEAPIPVSNLKLVCGNCGQGVRTGCKEEGGEKKRVCKKCGEEV